ncbi:Ref family recombination enhancement nuclease [Vibrio marisflavi]|uniref:Recombinase n=1 Tax=Vibrio marisflavi CECT 7928 TaxID=634439 RepID=A0ABN8E9C7_9VIBR|nr:Ref family recombination enhancement nuclease [Vibrio marisflavi]CAH0543001.1 hypothetical protein VMF7928_04354 [Vibrio marisflavi CECT 7928]
MKMTSEERAEKLILQRNAARQRAIERQLAKRNDPAEQQKQRDKLKARIEKQRAKYNDPEYRKQMREKALARKTTKPKAKPKSTRGLKGRAATAKETQVMNKIGQLSCIACSQHGRNSPIISLHHIKGRTTANAHMFVLPLCAFHHDTLLEKAQRERYPDMIPIHAKGKYGGRKQWKDQNGDELSLLKICCKQAGLDWDHKENLPLIHS